VTYSAATSLRPTPAPKTPNQPKWVVCEEDGHARQHQCFFAQDLVADAAPDLEADEQAHLGMVLGVLGGGGRRGVFERDAQPFGVFHPLNAQLPEQAVDGRGVVVAQHAVGPCIHDLASAHLGFAAARARAFSAKVLPIASGLHGHMQGKTLGGQTTAPSLAQSVVLPSMNTPFPLSALTNIFSGRPASKQERCRQGCRAFYKKIRVSPRENHPGCECFPLTSADESGL